ncbi:MAG: hypothetical protein J0M34_01690 [Alphaproteobacteria bacterium]|nr:hypothetical protein [Alphaproteobacteria bacterium]
MAENATVKSRIESEAEKEVSKARERALKKAKERNAVSEGFKTHTKGEKLFNDLTYTGLGYFGVTGLSVFMTWLIRDTKPLSNYFDKAVEAVSKLPYMKNGARSILNIGTLFLGGSLMTVTGVKILEDNKAPIVKYLDANIYYGKDAVEHDPEIVEAHKIIDSQPKQTWASVGYSRVVAFVATISSWLLIGQNKGWISQKLNTSIDTMGTMFGRWSSRTLKPSLTESVDNAVALDKQIAKEKGLGNNMRDLNTEDKHWSTRVLSYLGTDAIYTVITSVGLFISTRVLAPIFDKQGTEKLTAAAYEKEAPKALAQQTATLTSDVQREDEPKLPRVKVESVSSVERLSTQAAEQTVLRPAN